MVIDSEEATLVPINRSESKKVSMLENMEYFYNRKDGGDTLYALPYLPGLKTIMKIITTDKSNRYSNDEVYTKQLDEIPVDVLTALEATPKIKSHFNNICVALSPFHKIGFLYGKIWKEYEHLAKYYCLAVWGEVDYSYEDLENIAITIVEKNIKRKAREAKLQLELMLDESREEAKAIVREVNSNNFTVEWY